MTGVGVAWTAERDEVLRSEWAAKATAPEIAKKLGGFGHTIDGGRSAVIGRAHRLKLERRTTANRRKIDPEEAQKRHDERYQAELLRRKRVRAEARGVSFERTSAAYRAKAFKPMQPPYEPKGIPFGELRDFASSRANQCRYIDLQDKGPNFFYCGSETLPGESYCGHCAEITRTRWERTVSTQESQRRAASARRNVISNVSLRANDFTEAHV